MSAPVKQNSFSGGEIAPFLYGRTDQVKYETGLRNMRNLIAMRHGGATSRPGTMYVGTAQNGGAAVRLIPFIFNETGLGQSYVLEFGNEYIGFYQNGGVVVGTTPKTIPLYSASVSYGLYDVAVSAFHFNYISIVSNNIGNSQHNTSFWEPIFDWDPATTYNPGDYVRGVLSHGSGAVTGSYYVCLVGNINQDPLTASAGFWKLVASDYLPLTISSPYLQVDLATLKFAESADVVTIVHPNYPPYELKRLSATSWTLTAVTTGSKTTPINTLTCAPAGGAWNGTYTVTAVSPSGEESEGVSLTLTSVELPSVGDGHLLSWGHTGLPVPAYYNVYLNPTVTPSNVGGFIGRTSTGIFSNANFTPDFTNTPPQLNTLFNSVNNYPSAVGFVQQRRGFANTNNNPIGFWLSIPGSYANFDTHPIPLDSDAVIGLVAGAEVNSIQHLLELKFMLMLTAGAEIYVQGNGNGVVTPSSINASTQSQYGVAPLRVLKVADTLIFNQALGSFVRDLGFDFVIGGYRGNDLSVFSSHLFEGHSIVDWDFQKIPDSLIWAAREDGMLLGLTYVREQQILAWHRHDFTNGFVENVCCIPENGQYAVYLSIRRVINGVTVRYIERMSSRIWSDVLDATYLDCFAKYDGTNEGAITMTLASPTGIFTQDGTAYQQNLTLYSSAPFFNSSMVGDEIFINDNAFVANAGKTVIASKAGNQVRCMIISYSGPTQVTVTPSKAVPVDLQGIPITTWARAVRTVTGLDYLEGQQISVFADRFVVASPNNSEISFKAIVSGGAITLDKNYAVIYVGLPMTSDLETLDIETAFGETLIATRKRQNKLKIHMYNTRTLFAGSENPDNNKDNVNSDPLFQMFELKEGMNRQTYDTPPSLHTDQDYILEDTRYNKNGRIFIRNVDPIPLTILAVVPGGDSAAPNPAYERV